MIASADEIRSKVRDPERIREEVVAILPCIEDDIRRAMEEKRDYSRTELPTVFYIDTMTYTESRLRVYTRCIKILEGKGYKTSLHELVDAKGKLLSVNLIVRWFKYDRDDSIREMQDFLKTRTKTVPMPSKTPIKRVRPPPSNHAK